MGESTRKRPAHEPPPLTAPSKRVRQNPRVAYITRLSDEILLRVVALLSIRDLLSFQQASKRCDRIAVDGQIWKALFYRSFVRPRASRMRSTPSSALHYSSPNSRWLEDEGLSRDRWTNWKDLYKLRYKWNMGSCGIHEISITESDAAPPHAPPQLVKLHDGIVYTVDALNGLRAWGLRGGLGQLIAKATNLGAAGDRGAPTALAVDEESSVNVTVGFEDGGFSIYQLDKAESSFIIRYVHSSTAGANGRAVVSMAFLGPYLATICKSQSFVVYSFQGSADGDQGSAACRMMQAPKIVASLHSHTVWPPLSLSLRRSVRKSVLACIVYAFPLYVSGWSVGMQELRLTGEGNSRIATAVAAGFTPIATSSSGSSSPESQARVGLDPGSRSRSHLDDPPLARPTCVSYTHPYLLASHADNTLTLYLVKSTDTTLSIDSGQRLWGHTSAISSAQVSGRGKAVSVSSKGTEIRIWDLEGGVSERRRVNASVRVEPELRGTTSWNPDSLDWLGGFDEEKVVVLRDKGDKNQALVVYDFTR